LLVAAGLAGAPVYAQFAAIQGGDRLNSGQRVNLFLDWSGGEEIDGLALELPAGWVLHEAHSFRRGSLMRTPVRVSEVEAGSGTYHLTSTRPMRGAKHFVFGVTVGAETGYMTARVTPLKNTARGRQVLAARHTAWGGYVHEVQPAGRNWAFQLQGRADPVLLSRRALPGLNARDAFTFETWFKTTGLDEVMMSTWDGREAQAYPLELVVDRRGYLLVYRGEPGRHESMTTRRPVADGQWRHMAVTHDPEQGWLRLFLDGVAVDSIRRVTPLASSNGLSVALGGRESAQDGEAARPYTGFMDEVRFWRGARARASIRQNMRVQLTSGVGGLVRLDFDEPISDALLARPAPARIRALSDLSFTYPVEAFDAVVQGGRVILSWNARSRGIDRFVVERSLDGRSFQTAGTVRQQELLPSSTEGLARYAFSDMPPPGQVVYYRVRQYFADAPERVSGVLKLGFGEDHREVATILGNSPNPFNYATTITYELATPQHVRLSLWDLSGHQIAVLVDEPVGAGRHTQSFEAANLPSGVYFVRLQTPEVDLSHKMTLAK
jgi:hypothetical protein